jgi:hypothetical protein
MGLGSCMTVATDEANGPVADERAGRTARPGEEVAPCRALGAAVQ